ncbi:MAG: hypothetical protein WDN49_10835 [Acetobacteraceae bacterium]
MLVTVPLWLPLVGGYTALASRVLVMGLVAMALNFLLGFTGVMSFGHAAYFRVSALTAPAWPCATGRTARCWACSPASCSAALPARRWAR